MGQTEIQWTHRVVPTPDGSGTSLIPGFSWNPWWGCLKVADECKFCYAEGIAKHYGHDVWGPAANTSRRMFGEKHWQEPIKWNRQAQKLGHRVSVFCASMADVYEDHPDVVEARQRLWTVIAQTPWLNWLLLTKRPENIMSMSPYGQQWPDNVWVGTSVGTQKRAYECIPHLLAVPAAVRFLSVEPILESVDLTPWLAQLQWIICGGESGAYARPFDLDWARSLRDQCIAANVPYFFKQVGGRYHATGGRMLDGRTWDEIPPEYPLVQSMR